MRQSSWSTAFHLKTAPFPHSGRDGIRTRDNRCPTRGSPMWWDRWVSNPQPPGPHPGVLPNELLPHGGQGRTRTCDLSCFRRALFQLSYLTKYFYSCTMSWLSQVIMSSSSVSMSGTDSDSSVSMSFLFFHAYSQVRERSWLAYALWSLW